MHTKCSLSEKFAPSNDKISNLNFRRTKTKFALSVCPPSKFVYDVKCWTKFEIFPFKRKNASMNESANLFVPFRELSAYFLTCRSKLEETLELIIYSLVIFIFLNALLYCLIHKYRNGSSKFRFLRSTKLPQNVSRVLLVTAHPDDECMFFGPTLIALQKRENCRIFVLCMSRGESDIRTWLL